MSRPRFRYSPWDGTQRGFDVDALGVMEQLTDDLLYHGDLNSALRRMMQQGFEDRNGERIEGIREMLDKIRERREETLGRYDLGGVYDDIAKELRELVQQEREELDQLVEQARGAGDPRREELTEQTVAGKHLELDMLPPDLAGQVKGLEQYDFSSNEAQQRFDELIDKLREQLMQQTVDQMSGAMGSMSPEDSRAPGPNAPSRVVSSSAMRLTCSPRCAATRRRAPASRVTADAASWSSSHAPRSFARSGGSESITVPPAFTASSRLLGSCGSLSPCFAFSHTSTSEVVGSGSAR